MKPPKKYLDADRTEVNPEWLEWREEKERGAARFFGPDVHMQLYPEEHGRAIPKGGCWIRVLEEPFTELRARFRVPLQSIWRARPHYLNVGGLGVGRRPHQAVIATPGGDLHLWPWEYDIVPSVAGFIGREPDFVLHRLGGEPVFSGELEDQLFYLQSRGLTRHDASMLLLDDMLTTNFVYFTMADDLAEAMGGIGVPLWRHMLAHPRTRTGANA